MPTAELRITVTNKKMIGLHEVGTGFANLQELLRGNVGDGIPMEDGMFQKKLHLNKPSSKSNALDRYESSHPTSDRMEDSHRTSYGKEVSHRTSGLVTRVTRSYFLRGFCAFLSHVFCMLHILCKTHSCSGRGFCASVNLACLVVGLSRCSMENFQTLKLYHFEFLPFFNSAGRFFPDIRSNESGEVSRITESVEVSRSTESIDVS